MKENNFERELPVGYRVAKTIDAKNKKFAITFNLIGIFVAIAVVALAFIPLLINTQRLTSAEDIYFSAPILFVALVIYILLHEIVHGIAYKIKTGEKLTFGLSWSCAFCGVPKILTYRKTALTAILAPVTVFSIILIPLIIIAYFINANIYLLLVMLFGFHLGGSSGDIYVAYLLLAKYKDDKTLMNDTGPKMTLLVYDEALFCNFDDETTLFLAEFNHQEDEIVKEKEKKQKTVNIAVISIIGIVFFSIGLVISTACTIMRNNMLYENPYHVYELYSFYTAIFSALGIVFFALTFKRFASLKIIIIILLALFGPFLLIITAFQGYQASHTTDVNNYGVYDYPDYMPDYFPEKITEDMTPIKYSYYFDYSWDWCYDIYLEVEMTEEEYQKYKTKYENGLVECWYSAEHKEYVISDEPDLEFYDDGSCWASNPDVEKIIFNDEENTIIFWALLGIDPFNIENSYFFERFDVDPMTYKEIIETSEEKE